MVDARRVLGQKGEDIAAHYLVQCGYELLARNWRCARGEIDIVAQEGDTLAFVEVRTRRGDDFGSPEESVTAAKQMKLLDLAQLYLQENETDDVDEVDWRIDVVAIKMGRHGEVRRLNLIRHAVSA